MSMSPIWPDREHQQGLNSDPVQPLTASRVSLGKGPNFLQFSHLYKVATSIKFTNTWNILETGP